jgi:hypothetical protein
MGRINDEYIPAVLNGRIALITNFGRYFGRTTRSGLKKWQSDGLVVVVDDMHFAMVATYRKRLVAASLPNQLVFIMEDWWQIIERRREQIRQATRQAYMARARETLSGLMKGGLH